MRHRCDNCDKLWDEGKLAEIKDYSQRVEAGGVVPSGECPGCGALCYPEKKPDSQVLRALRAELYSCRGGHQRELQGDLESLSEAARTQLLHVVRDLKQEASRARHSFRPF